MDLSRGGRIVRTVTAVTVVVGVVVSNQWGSDDDFPFAPFKMYATSRALDEPVGDTQILGLDDAGRKLPLTQAATGIRRAEIEGQLPRFVDDPDLLALVADAYAARNPGLPALSGVSIVVEWNELDDGVVTGSSWIEEVVTWRR